MAKDQSHPIHGFIHGFTLLELLVTLSIIAITLSLAVPAMAGFIQNQRLRSASSQLYMDFMFARSMALNQGRQIVLCPSIDAESCVAQSDWEMGWLVFNDTNFDRQRQPEEPLLRIGSRLDSLSARSSIYRPNIRFYPDGSATGSAARITLCPKSGQTGAYEVIIANSGRIRQARIPLSSPVSNCEN